jgi:DNA-directed RNA polymerase sigma subunit (sigma70/sigma32)
MGSKSAPKYATTTTKTGGLFGESTNSKNGSSFTAEDWQTNMGGLGSNLINQSLTGLSSNDYSQDPNFQVYQDNFNRGMQQAYDTNVLANLNDRGLMRSSGLQSATNSFNNTMQQGLADLYDSYYNRQQNNLNSALNAQNNLYSWITGLNKDAATNSKNVSDYNMQAYQTEQAAKQAMFNSLMQSVGAIGGAALGNGGSLTGLITKK